MNIVLISNFAIPSVAKEIGISVTHKEGWVTGLIDALQQQEHKLHYVFPQRKNKTVLCGNANGMAFYGFSRTAKKDWTFEPHHETQFTEIFQKIGQIDVIHIMGSEYAHTLSAVNAAQKLNLLDKVVISIQGMPSVYASHVYADLPLKTLLSFTLRDLLRGNNLYLSKFDMINRGKTEVEAIKKVKHIIGRTDWDRACTQQINPYAQYHFCNETLRREFYCGQWEYANCRKHSVFMSQGYNSIKGMHYMLEALSIVRDFYPDVQLSVTGESPLHAGFLKRQKRSAYTNYLQKLIEKNQLAGCIRFLGTLNAEQMKEQYLAANVFVSPSSIENSPNSVGEAMILGTPVVTSDVGGVKNLITHGEEGFVYQHSAPYMLAHYIMKVFEQGSAIEEMTRKAQAHAKHTHDGQNNTRTLIAIYKSICQDSAKDPD